MHLIGYLERLAKVEVHQGVHSQELEAVQVLLLGVVVRACTHNIVQVFPEEINVQLVLLAYYKLSGLTGGLANLGQNSHLA